MLHTELIQFDIKDIELKTLLFQTGYLTIKSYDPESRNYILGYVNKETIDSLGITFDTTIRNVKEIKHKIL